MELNVASIFHVERGCREGDAPWSARLHEATYSHPGMSQLSLGSHVIFICARFQRYLQVILSDEIRVQDKLSAFGATLRKAENVDVVLDFVLTNHQTIAKA